MMGWIVLFIIYILLIFTNGHIVIENNIFKYDWSAKRLKKKSRQWKNYLNIKLGLWKPLDLKRVYEGKYITKWQYNNLIK